MGKARMSSYSVNSWTMRLGDDVTRVRRWLAQGDMEVFCWLVEVCGRGFFDIERMGVERRSCCLAKNII